MTITHHPDCDGYRMHSAVKVIDSHEGRGMWHQECVLEECNWRDPVFGNYGKDAYGTRHERHDECTGQCHSW